jgi:Ankyrin repeats (3 copies)
MPRKTMPCAVWVCLFSAAIFAGEQEDKFLLAVRTADVATVKTMLGAGFNPNTKYRYDRMPLSFAADRGNVEVVTALLDAGADVNAADSYYRATAMDWALNKGHLPLVKLLLARGARNSEQLLMTGVDRGNLEILKASLDKGGLEPHSLTAALSRATRNNKTEIADALKAAGATPPRSLEPALLDKYAGTYRPESGAEFTFARKEGNLMGGPPGQSLLMLALDETTFRPEQLGGITIRFNLDASGAVTGATLKQNNTETNYKRVEAKP